MFVKDLWYFGALSNELKPGQHLHRELLGQPILFGRDHDGKAYALKDICPHRGILLSGGGDAALAKLRLLLKTEARIEVFAETPAPEITTWAADGRLSLHLRPLAPFG